MTRHVIRLRGQRNVISAVDDAKHRGGFKKTMFVFRNQSLIDSARPMVYVSWYAPKFKIQTA